MYNLLILGSGRSGTSMITGSLANNGYNFGDDFSYLGKNVANPKGFFEDYEVNTINEDILALHVIHIPEKLRKVFFPSTTFYRSRWLARISKNKSIYKSSLQIDEKIKNLLLKTPFCFKDPRFSYTLPVWLRNISSDTKFVVVFREPEKTAESIVRECNESKNLSRLKMNKKIALQIWYCMYSHILRNYKTYPAKDKWFFIHYDQIFDNQILESLEHFTGAVIKTDFAEKRLSRTNEMVSLSHKKSAAIYSSLCKLASYKLEK